MTINELTAIPVAELKKQLKAELLTLLEYKGFLTDKAAIKDVEALVMQVFTTIKGVKIYAPIKFEIAKNMSSMQYRGVRDVFVIRFEFGSSWTKEEVTGVLVGRLEEERRYFGHISNKSFIDQVRLNIARAMSKSFNGPNAVREKIEKGKLDSVIRSLKYPSARKKFVSGTAYVCFPGVDDNSDNQDTIYRPNVLWKHMFSEDLATKLGYVNLKGYKPNHLYIALQEVSTDTKLSCIREELSKFYVFELEETT